MIQGLVVLFVGAEPLLILGVWQSGRRRTSARRREDCGMSVGAEAAQARHAGSRIATARNVGIAGIALGAFALWLALPPLAIRTVVAPIVVGALAGVLGVGAITRGERPRGLGRCCRRGSLGMIGGVAAAQAGSWPASRTSSRGRRSSHCALVWTTPLTFAAIGGLVSERSGVVNADCIEGMMLMGAFFGIWGADVTGWWFGGLVIAMIAGGAHSRSCTRCSRSTSAPTRS